MAEPTRTTIAKTLSVAELQTLDLEIERNIDVALKGKTPAEQKALLENAATIHLAYLRARNEIIVPNNQQIETLITQLKQAKTEITKALNNLKNTPGLLNAFSVAADIASQLTKA